jgi:beta-1,4-N-acetylglucosaminyltransferase
MIFVTVGNDYRDFERLLRQVDKVALRIPSDVVVQRGYSRYQAKNVKSFDFIPMNEAIEYIKQADLVVSHAGIGTIILCKKFGIPLLIFPRRKQFGEHMNDHQLEIARALEERMDRHIHVVYEEDQLEHRILEALRNREPYPPAENVGRKNLIRSIRDFIERA